MPLWLLEMQNLFNEIKKEKVITTDNFTNYVFKITVIYNH